jgi:hypothetical protein
VATPSLVSHGTAKFRWRMVDRDPHAFAALGRRARRGAAKDLPMRGQTGGLAGR